MKLPGHYLHEQYQLVRGSRRVVFDYCKTISPADFVNQDTLFGKNASVSNLLVHIANTYLHWIAKVALQKQVVYAESGGHNNIEEVVVLYNTVDEFMVEFIARTAGEERGIEIALNGRMSTVTSLQLFTHVITHEYHHKGQVMALSRHLGYTPVDADIIR